MRVCALRRAITISTMRADAVACLHAATGGGASLEMLEGKEFKTVDILDET